ncbi:MAG: DUF3108 domain-containing protein, partial [Blastocatellia bacterium]
LQPGTSDLLSLFYVIRAADLKVGKTQLFRFLDANHRLQLVMVSVVKQESIGGPMGTRDALQLDIMTPQPTQILLAQVWLSNDTKKLPLYFATRTRFGELRFQMTSAAITKYLPVHYRARMQAVSSINHPLAQARGTVFFGSSKLERTSR